GFDAKNPPKPNTASHPGQPTTPAGVAQGCGTTIGWPRSVHHAPVREEWVAETDPPEQELTDRAGVLSLHPGVQDGGGQSRRLKKKMRGYCFGRKKRCFPRVPPHLSCGNKS